MNQDYYETNFHPKDFMKRSWEPAKVPGPQVENGCAQHTAVTRGEELRRTCQCGQDSAHVIPSS